MRNAAVRDWEWEGRVSTAKTEGKGERETPPEQAAGSPTSSRSWKKLLPSIGCEEHKQSTEEGSRGDGRVSAVQDQTLLAYQTAPPGPPAQPSPEPHGP